MHSSSCVGFANRGGFVLVSWWGFGSQEMAGVRLNGRVPNLQEGQGREDRGRVTRAVTPLPCFIRSICLTGAYPRVACASLVAIEVQGRTDRSRKGAVTGAQRPGTQRSGRPGPGDVMTSSVIGPWA